MACVTIKRAGGGPTSVQNIVANAADVATTDIISVDKRHLPGSA